MTIRRMWLVILIAVSVLSVGINSLILTSLTDRYFKEYLKESYDTHINQILDYTQKALMGEKPSYQQLKMELEVHLADPIIGLKLYTPDGELLIGVEADHQESFNTMSDMMNNRMNKMFASGVTGEIRQYVIDNEGTSIGILNVTLQNLAENSFVAWRFKSSLLSNSIISIIVVSILVVFIGLIISRKMSKALSETAKMASNIQIGESSKLVKTSIKEINAIRESLDELDTRLKLKQKSRKALTDEMLHQTRTPLTILKSHIEAIQDNVIEVTEVELDICQNQIDNITSIISNLGEMMDADKESEKIHLEEIEIGELLNQIVSGLMPQFKNKFIRLEILTKRSFKVKTDQYKLSQSVFNILTNAYKYTLAHGSVEVSYVKSNNNLIIKIEDTGVGIENDDLEKVFNAYYRGGNQLQTKGDGIGLFIVKENITKMGGFVSIESIVDKGSTVIIELPCE